MVHRHINFYAGPDQASMEIEMVEWYQIANCVKEYRR